MRIPPSQAKLCADTGCLELDVRPVADCRLRLASWTNGLTLERFEDGTWVPDPEDPCMPFLASALRLPIDDPVRRFVEPIPPQTLALAASSGPFELTALRLLRFHPSARDLAVGSPNLFWLVAASAAARSPSFADLSHVLGLRRRDVLAWAMGVEGAAASVKFVDKFLPLPRGEDELRLLAAVVSQPEIVWLFRHHSRVRPGTLRVVLRHHRIRPELLGARFYGDAAMHAGDTMLLEDALSLSSDARRLGHLLGIPNSGTVVAAARTVADLRMLHDRWTARANEGRHAASLRQLLDKHGNARFPDPPLPGSPDIIAIRTVHQLLEEGREMRHCVGSYVWRCLEGACFIYKVIAPARATAELRVVEGRPRLVQLRGPGNAAPPEACWSSVRSWMQSAAASTKANANPV